MRLGWALVAVAVVLAGCGDSAPKRRAAAPPGHGAADSEARSTAPARPARALARLRVVATRTLAQAVQRPALAAAHGTLFAAGGLDARDTPVARVIRAAPGTPRLAGSLPQAVHDAGAAALDGRVYVFGGGTATGSSDRIVELGRGRPARVVGRLPAPASDLAAARVGDVIYVVGGYTGNAPLRYAAVAAVGLRLLIAGGTDGAHARADILSFDPVTRRVRPIGRLSRPVAHAAAAALGGVFYLVGGRGDVRGSARRTIVAVDPRSGRVRAAGALPTALSDLAVAALGGRIWVVGGRDDSGVVHGEVLQLRGSPRAAALRPRRVPALVSRADVYAADRAGRLPPGVRGDPARVYVPNSESDTVDVVSQRTGRIVEHFAVGALPQHVTPSWDLRTLWVTNDRGNSLTPIDPRTGRHGLPVPVTDPYNLYFTADGRRAIVVAEAHRELDFRTPHTMRLTKALPVPMCHGVDHMDYTSSGRFALVSCEFNGRMIVVDLRRERVVKTIALSPGAMPQDVKLSPDG